MKIVVHNINNLPLRKISELVPAQGDLKDLSKENYDKLKMSIEKHGFIYPIAVWTDDKGVDYLLDGHQRKRVLDTEAPETEVPVIQIPAATLQEAAEILLKITSQYGTITQEGLDAFIAAYKLPEVEILQAIQFDALTTYLGDDEETPYTGKIEPPVYEITGEQPKLTDLYQTDKTGELIKEIMSSDLDDATKKFLMAAANRHTVFNYAKIAEFYAHATPELQELMEKSALVIIDYDKAVENGFVSMSEAIAEGVSDEA